MMDEQQLRSALALWQIPGMVQKALNWAEKPNHTILYFKHPDYPPKLLEISHAPPILFVLGDVKLLKKQQLAIVGSRHPTQAGLSNSFNFARHLSQSNLCITSGLALGIDAAAHSGALEGPSKTIAVMATGIDNIYPKTNYKLAQQIIEHGALISEFPFGTPPRPEFFPRRNRIISGLSSGTLVVEAAQKSGSLITARYALEQNREVFAIPGSIHNPLSKGCHELIRQGAKLVETAQDILEELNMQYAAPPLKQSAHPLLQYISTNPTPIDIIINRSATLPHIVSSDLLTLELQGYIKAVPGGYIRI